MRGGIDAINVEHLFNKIFQFSKIFKYVTIEFDNKVVKKHFVNICIL